ncbi:hypothetical protein [Jannaschia aquimarina]|uniref:Uncharacterized protein n=1 Tax=Jannaschia aquimarina TaxID=935700 RepID=A0A0D1DAK3_9RHOB|nr:hypothetical protein [Jannaschia aquimarina]KIT16968.1 hypothetical protein jaqu_12810 [Jannaschia aquimarina]SNT33275.1 hypothetical protein SAMN05421775_111121 [Jannaschia aquimarina]
MTINEFLTTGQAWWVTFLILGCVILVVSATSAFVGWAVRDGADRRALILFPAIFVLWGGGALATSLTLVLEFTWFLPFALFPIILGSAMSFLPVVAGVLARVPVHWMIGLQTYRVLGGLFLYPYMAEGILTPGFSWPAGVGDVLTGLAAPFVAIAVLRDPEGARRIFYAWTAFGILDLIVAPLSAAIWSFGVGGQDMTFAVTAIPLFLGPPFGILIHIMTWRAFELQRRQSDLTASSARSAPAE